LARGQVSADGTFSVSVVIPISTEPGKQSVVASAGGAQATAELSVRTEPARSVLPLTGSMASPWLAAAGVALALGAVMAFARRGRESADGRARGR
jgi:LPXTG-motif cell wall-anchored protein